MSFEETYSVAVEEVYWDVLAQFSETGKEIQKQVPHWTVPTPTLHADECMPSTHPCTPLLNSQFPFEVDRALPLLPPVNVHPSALRKGDPLQIIVTEQKEWNQELKRLINRAKKSKNVAEQMRYVDLHKVKKCDEDKPIYAPLSYLKVAKHLSKEPHPYFTGEFNWLSTGGCLSYCNVGNKTLLLTPQGKEMDSLSICELQENNSHWSCGDSKYSGIVALTPRQRSYQVIAQSTSREGVAAVRQINVCSIFHLSTDSDELSARSVLEFQNTENIFTSMDLNLQSDNQFCTIDSDFFLKIWDLSLNSCVSSAQLYPDYFDSEGDERWSFVKFLNDSNLILLSNRKSLCLKDLRTSLTESVQEHKPMPILDDCESISLTFNSKSSDNVIYAATLHRLLSLDLRSSWIQRWTHLLRSPPMYGSSVTLGSSGTEELIALSSWTSDETVAIINTWNNDKPHSSVLPVALPPVRDALHWVNVCGECLSPNLANRTKLLTAGQTFLPTSGNNSVSLAKSTSIGDVFSQRLVLGDTLFHEFGIQARRSPQQDEIDLKVWKEWESQHEVVCKRNPPDLKNVSLANRKDLLDVVRAPLEKNAAANHKVKMWKRTFPAKTKSSTLSCSASEEEGQLYTELSAYKDVMAEVFLRTWASETNDFTPQSTEEPDYAPSDVSLMSYEFDTDEILSIYSEVSNTSISGTPNSQSKSNKKAKTQSMGF